MIELQFCSAGILPASPNSRNFGTKIQLVQGCVSVMAASQPCRSTKKI